MNRNPNRFLSDIPITRYGGYNLSILRHGGSEISTHRYHPDKGWKTRLAIDDGQSLSDILFPDELKDYSLEDARLFTHNGKLMLSYVVADAYGDEFRCVVGYGMLVQREGRWRIEKHYQPNFTGNDYTGLVKNWCPFERDGRMFFIWGVKDGNQIVIEVDGEKVISEFRAPVPKWDYGEIRGGAIVKIDGYFLRLFHSRTGEGLAGQPGTFQYHIGALLMDFNQPFQVFKVGNYPILSGDERFIPGVFHWKANCILAMGAILESDGRIRVGVGRNDSSCEIITLSFSDLHLD